MKFPQFWKRDKQPKHDEKWSLTPEQDLELARKLVKEGDLSHAVQHLAWALNQNPLLPGGRELLDDLIARSPDPLSLAPLSEQNPVHMVGTRAYIHVKLGQLENAIDLLAQIYQAVPGMPFLAWLPEWFANVEQVNQVDQQTMGRLLINVRRKIPKELGPDGFDLCRKLLPTLAAYWDSHPPDTRFSFAYSVVARELGEHEQAIKVAEAAHKAEPSYFSAVALGGAYKAINNSEAALAAYRAAYTFNTDNLEILLDIGDALMQLDRWSEALAEYQKVTAQTLNHPWAKPSAMFCHHMLEPNGRWFDQLVKFAEQNPDNERAQYLVHQAAPYFLSLPEPSDATINIMRQVVTQQGEMPETMKMGLSSLESPSARRAAELAQIERYGKASFIVSVADLPEPDPRLPRGEVDFVLWKYNGTDPIPNFPPPAAEIAAQIGTLAAEPYSAPNWSAQGQRIAQTIGAAKLNDLLGAMLHPPKRPAAIPMWVWLHRSQVASAFVIAHLDEGEGWQGSLRRRSLLSLARGPLDWTVEAVIIVLAQLVRENPDLSEDVAALYLELANNLPSFGGVPYTNALIACSLKLPRIPTELAKRMQELTQAFDD